MTRPRATDVSDSNMHDALTQLANDVARLTPNWKDARGFYERRSSAVGKLRSLANSPLAVKKVIRFVPAETKLAPAPAPASAPAPTAPAPAWMGSAQGSLPLPEPTRTPEQAARDLDGPTVWVHLTADETVRLDHVVRVTKGGFRAKVAQWQARRDPVTGRLGLSNADIAWIWRTGSRPAKGGAQRHVNRIFWRTLSPLFDQLGMVPNLAPIVLDADGAPRNRAQRKSRRPPRRLSAGAP